MNDYSDQNEISALINRLPAMVYRCQNDRDWTMLFLSNGCQPLTGYTREQLLFNKEISFLEIIHPEDRAMVNENVSVALQNNTSFICEYRIITKDSTQKWVWEQGIATYGPSGEPRFIDGFITDITAFRMANNNAHKKSR